MFTGIITHLGTLKKLTSRGLVVIETPKSLYKQVENSHSVAVDGICLTVIKKQAPNLLHFEAMPETVQKTHLAKIKNGQKINLELPVKPDGEMGGHFVQGHVDGTGKITQIKRRGNSWIFTIETPKKLMPYIVDKGSITINGISLTVIKAGKDYFTTGIIPYTWKHTMLHQSQIGDIVNLETDILAKYIVKLVRRMR